ncbi:MAG TPA: hypothetical protein VJ922_07510 [Actinomycetota bacterium]|nr:hypothetical protein [Actinomycetota bacterium]
MNRKRLVIGVLIALSSLAAAQASTSSAIFTDGPGVGANGFTTATLLAPTGLGATAGCQTLAPKITLTWTATTSTFADGYDVYRSTTSGGPYSSIAHVNGRTTAIYVDASGLSLNTTYYYVIRSTAYGWTSANSSQASAKTPFICLF